MKINQVTSKVNTKTSITKSIERYFANIHVIKTQIQSKLIMRNKLMIICQIFLPFKQFKKSIYYNTKKMKLIIEKTLSCISF